MNLKRKVDLGDTRPRHNKVSIPSDFHYHERTRPRRNMIADLEAVLIFLIPFGSFTERYKWLVVRVKEHLFSPGRVLMRDKVKDRLGMRSLARHNVAHSTREAKIVTRSEEGTSIDGIL